MERLSCTSPDVPDRLDSANRSHGIVLNPVGGGTAENGLPSGGSAGEFLKKSSGVDYASEWASITAGNVSGLGGAAVLNVGTTAGTVAAGDDSRINNGETAYGWGDHDGLYDASGAASVVAGNLTTHEGLTTAAHGGLVASSDARLTDARTPTAHAASHQHSGGDEIATATAAANAIPKADGTGKLDSGWLPPIANLEFDTAENILASTPDDNATRASTDTANETLYVYNATTGKWWELTAYLAHNKSTPTPGARQDNNRAGYARGAVAAKLLVQCTLGGNDYPSIGGIRRYYDPLTGRTEQQFYNEDGWGAVVSGIRIATVESQIGAHPFLYPVDLMTGDSLAPTTPGATAYVGNNGRPLIRGGKCTPGAYPSGPFDGKRFAELRSNAVVCSGGEVVVCDGEIVWN